MKNRFKIYLFPNLIETKLQLICEAIKLNVLISEKIQLNIVFFSNGKLHMKVLFNAGISEVTQA